MIAQNTFTDGLIMDLNPLTTPKTVLTDALNATIITYDGEEFVLQNDKGNCKVERAKLSVGFIPIGMEEYGGIVYVASYNPETGEGELGSFPSPERDFSTRDFENLSPAKFVTSDFIVNTGTPVNESTSVLTKLVEPELLELNPGDMFLVTYDIHEPTPSGTADIIDNKVKMDEYISKDVANRKLFKLRFYKFTADKNLANIDPDDINLVDINDDLEDQYVYFKEKNKGTIAVGLELETLDSFDINVIDTSKKVEELKSATIEAVGFSDSLADFQGVKVDITEPEVDSFYIDKIGNTKKVSAKISELVANSKLVGSITPYSDYALYPKLKRDFNLELGKYASSGDGINNIFRYKVNANSVVVDFDFKFEGNNPNGLVLYIEFYDPWSDYSIIKIVDNPTYYGINSVVMELIDEPTTDIFNSSQAGGTSKLNLIPNSDTEYLKTMLNESGLIRTTSVLRKNHFYIVRISGIDIDPSTIPTTYTHYDLYKGMYTNNMFNTIYDLQNSIPETSPQYVADFNELDFDLSEVKYSVATTESNNVNAVPVITLQRPDLMTDGNYYKVSPTVLATTPGYKHTKNYKNNKTYNLSLSLTGTERIFGTFKEELVDIEMPTLANSASSTGIKPTIQDLNYNEDPFISPESFATWQINQLAAKSFQLLTETTTKRSVYSEVLNQTRNDGSIYAEVNMGSQFYSMPNGDGPFNFVNANAVLRLTKYEINIRRPDGSVYYYTRSGRAVDDDVFSTQINNNMNRPNTAAMLMGSNESTWWYKAGENMGYGCTRNSSAYWKETMLLVMKEDGNWMATRTHDYTAMKEFFNSLFIASKVAATVYTYYPSQNIKANEQINTTVTYPIFEVITSFAPTAPTVKTYLSTIMFKAISDTRVEFNTTNVNDYIEERKGDSIIVDNKDTIRDGFIPYIDEEKQSSDTVTIPQTTINQSADNTVVTKMATGNTLVNADPAFAGGRYEHGLLFSDNPNYRQYLSLFTVQGVVSGVQITPNNVSIRARNSSNFWQGVSSRLGRCDQDDRAIDLLPDIMITRT